MPHRDVHFYILSTSETSQRLDTPATGLTAPEAKRRLSYYGPNRLPEAKRAQWWQILLEQFKSPLVYVLLTAAIVSLVLNERVDGVVIMVAVAVQVVVGFIQEYKAQASLSALQKVISLSARVQRDNKEQVINAVDLVPGDLILLQAGDKIPADIRLVHTADFNVTEAALTGESEAIEKNAAAQLANDVPLADRINCVFAGTVATKGSASGIVTHTGAYTEVGHIAQLIKDTSDEATPLQEQLTKFAKKISILVIGIALLIFLVGYFLSNAIVQSFTVAVAVAVSAIPEGLAIAVTIILAAGMQRILKRKALVRKLVAAETLGSTDVICTDKTGTLTQGKMLVTDIVTWDNNFDVHHRQPGTEAAQELVFALQIGMLCNDAKVNNPDDMIDAWVISGNLTERALLLAASQVGLHYATLLKTAPRIDQIPFDSSIKYMATLHREVHGHILYIKGAPEVILKHATYVLADGKEIKFTEDKQKQFEHKFIALSKRGLRIIAVAYKHAGTSRTISDAGLDELVFVGYIGIKDPLRPEAKQTVAECKTAGIQTVMITGDHKLTAQAIADELGITILSPASIVEGHELDIMSQHELNRRVLEISVYARVTPQHKLRIVQAWQSHGKVVAMTGDGINDAPAIKAADIGIALGSGTDVAKDTADMVILDDNFDTIVAAVEEGRGIFDNIRKTVLYLISDSFSEVIIIIGSLVIGLPVPLLASQILWVNLVNDSFPSLAMTQEVKEKENMMEPPRGRKVSIFNQEIKWLIFIISVMSGILSLAAYYYIYTTTGNLDLARTLTFFTIGIDSLFIMFSIRSLRRMIYYNNIMSNPWLLGAFAFGIIFMLLPVYIPQFQYYLHTHSLGWFEISIALIISLLQVVVIEVVKYIFLRRRAQQTI